MKKVYFMLSLLSATLYGSDYRIGGQLVIDRAISQNDDSDLSDSEIRRARLFVKGKFSKKVAYEVEYSFTSGGKWKDIYLRYLFNKNFSMTLGNIKEPIGLEALTSSKYNTFLERSLTDMFISDRKLGLLLSYGTYKKREFSYHLSFGGFTKDVNDLQSDDKYSLVARGTYAHFINKNSFVHVGLSGAYTDYDDAKIKLSTRLESHLSETKYLKTKIKNVDYTKRIGTEMVVQYKPMTLQGEYFSYQMQTNTDNVYNYNGWYVQISSFLSNDSRRYKYKEGIFGRMKPTSPVSKKGFGAIELTLRTSYVDLNDGVSRGGTAQTNTIGLNWYLLKNMRVMVNYLTSEVTTEDASYDPTVVQARFQYDF